MKKMIAVSACMLVLAALFMGCAQKEGVKWARRPMIMVDGELYLDTGKTVEPDASSFDSARSILSSIDVSEVPKENGQSNFGLEGNEYVPCQDGYAVNMDDKWIFFEKENES